MKQAIGFGMRLGVGAALSLMLGAVSTAQRAAAAPSLELGLHLMGNDQIDPRAVIPLAADLGKVLTLSGGAPGSLALIEVGRVGGQGGRSFGRCAVFTGAFGPTGQFEVEIPPSIDLRGFGARGAQAPTRMVTVALDLDDAVEEAFIAWENLGSLPKPQGAFSAGGRVRTTARSPGRLGQAQVGSRFVTRAVDNGGEVSEPGNGTSWENLGSLPRPQGGMSVGGQVVQSPARRAGHLGQAGDPDQMVTHEVDNGADVSDAGNGTSWENLGSLPRPLGGVSASGQSQGGGGVIVCPANLPLISFEILGSVARPRRAGTPDAGPGRAARRDRP